MNLSSVMFFRLPDLRPSATTETLSMFTGCIVLRIMDSKSWMEFLSSSENLDRLILSK